MKFEELDIKMRVYEESHDYCVLPNMYMIARLDGRGFSRLTLDMELEKPFDKVFTLFMRGTVEYLMESSGFHFLYGYTQSDEISLLFKLEENTFKRKLRKLNSSLAGLASSYLSLKINKIVSFDCRISQLPSQELVKDYFSWRQSDSVRNSLNAYSYWSLRKDRLSARQATNIMYGLNKSQKIDLLLNRGIDFYKIPEWQREGVGFYYQNIIKEGFNPKTQEKVFVDRRRLMENEVLPSKEDYRFFIKRLLNV